VARITGGRLVAGDGGAVVRGVACDSRLVKPHDLFVALAGERVDGHDFAPRAVDAGAVCLLVERPPRGTGEAAVVLVNDTLAALGALAAAHRGRFDPTVVAVTGSAGKTTTKDMIAAVCAARFCTLKSPGNFNTDIGLPLALFGLDERHEAAVVETAMRGPGEIARLCRIARPRIGVVTNVGPAHLELLGSIENIAAAKMELVLSLGPVGTAVLNADDPRVRAMARSHPGPVAWFGLDAPPSPAAGPCLWRVTAAGVEPADRDGGTRFQATAAAADGGRHEAAVDLPLAGRHNVVNALAALAVGLVLGVPLRAGADALAGVSISGGRWTVSERAGITIIDDTYNANPASMAAAMEAAAGIAPGRWHAALGDMLELGSEAPAAHRKVGRLAVRWGVHTLATVGELARHIAAAARDEGLSPERAHACGDHGTAAGYLAQSARPGDVILVKGSRGSRMELVIDALRRRLPADREGESG